MKLASVALCLTIVTGIATIAPPLAAVNVCCPQVAPNNGRITVLFQGKPVSGAQVEFTSEKEIAVSFVTGEDGVAKTKDLRPGHYNLIASHDEGVSKQRGVEVTEIAGVSTIAIELIPDPDIPPDLPSGIRIQKLAGMVIDASGAVISKTRIRIFRRVAGRPLVLRVKADEAGRFQGNLDEGPYVALVSAFGFKTSVVPFEITRSGSGDLRIQLQVAAELPTT